MNIKRILLNCNETGRNFRNNDNRLSDETTLSMRVRTKKFSLHIELFVMEKTHSSGDSLMMWCGPTDLRTGQKEWEGKNGWKKRTRRQWNMIYVIWHTYAIIFVASSQYVADHSSGCNPSEIEDGWRTRREERVKGWRTDWLGTSTEYPTMHSVLFIRDFALKEWDRSGRMRRTIAASFWCWQNIYCSRLHSTLSHHAKWKGFTKIERTKCVEPFGTT